MAASGEAIAGAPIAITGSNVIAKAATVATARVAAEAVVVVVVTRSTATTAARALGPWPMATDLAAATVVITAVVAVLVAGSRVGLGTDPTHVDLR